MLIMTFFFMFLAFMSFFMLVMIFTTLSMKWNAIGWLKIIGLVLIPFVFFSQEDIEEVVVQSSILDQTSNELEDPLHIVSGEDVDIHGTMIALQEADISIRTMSAFRDKITDAYKNLINMAI